jgi:triphosphoribosyl-dephospho-CoA synthetase
MSPKFKPKKQNMLQALGIENQEDLEKEVQKCLDYMMSEGFVVKIGSKYRIKTQQEIQQEVEQIERI